MGRQACCQGKMQITRGRSLHDSIMSLQPPSRVKCHGRRSPEVPEMQTDDVDHVALLPGSPIPLALHSTKPGTTLADEILNRQNLSVGSPAWCSDWAGELWQETSQGAAWK